MAISVTQVVQSAQTGTTFSQAVTLSATCTKLVVGFGIEGFGGTITSIDYNGVALTQGVTSTAVFGTKTWIYYLDNPPTGSSYNVNFTYSSSGATYYGILELAGTNSGVGASNSTSHSGSATTTSMSLTTTVNNSLIINCIAVTVSNASSPTSGETSRWTGNDLATNMRSSGASLVKATAGAQTTSYSHGNGGATMSAIEILEYVAPASNPKFLAFMR